MPAGFARIAAQHAIALDLRGREHVHGGEMVFEMGLPQRCLRGPDPGRGTRQAVGGDGALGEQPIEMRFLADQPLAERNRLRPHRLVERLHTGALLARQGQRAGMLEDMDRAGIAVQLCREGEAHAAARPQIGDLVARQRLHGAALEAGIRRARAVPVLGERRPDQEDRQDKGGKHVRHAVNSQAKARSTTLNPIATACPEKARRVN